MGMVEVHTPMVIDGDTDVIGQDTILHAAHFNGPAVIVVRGNNVRLTNFSIDGNRDTLATGSGLPDYRTPFARFTRNNGVLADGIDGLRIENVGFQDIAGFAVLVSRSRHVSIDRVHVADSGGLDAAGHDNTTGGILLEEGTSDFSVTHCDLWRVRGNGIWTHSLYTSPRNARGSIAWNGFWDIGRDAIQVGHATEVRVERNHGIDIGAEKAGAIPVGLDTAGNVDRSIYAHNSFTAIAGKCIDLDGFHDGVVTFNVCLTMANFGIVMNNSNPDMRSQNIQVTENTIDSPRYGGIFVIGTGHLIAHNRISNVNTSHSGSDLLASGIYLGLRAERPDPAQGNTIEDNQITGYEMRQHCIGAAPGILPSWNVVRDNQCR